METKYINLDSGEWLSDVFKREGFPLDSIPTNCIFNKTLCGLGATYSEIMSPRNSIIIEPNLPVIKGKITYHSGLLGIYEGVKDSSIIKYLTNSNIEFKKILCTPESYSRLLDIAISNGIDLYANYFCLFDECEKITQDIDYREGIAFPIRDFFKYKFKALVSATPLEIKNPDFESNNFYKLIIKPTFIYKRDINLVITNSFDKSLIRRLEELKDRDRICVFYNSTNGINKIVNYLEGKGISDYKVFCSTKSVIKSRERGIDKSFEELSFPLAKYNFFTSRFFSAVDIYLDKEPDIIILTNFDEAKYSLIDPITNTVQICGRFRNSFNDGKKFHSVTHITNLLKDRSSDEVLSNDEIESYIDASKNLYYQVKGFYDLEADIGKKKLYKEDLSRLFFNKFLNPDKSLNYFSIDNFYDDERVKSYYKSVVNLKGSYPPDHFNVILVEENEAIGDEVLLRYKKLKSEIETRRFIVDVLDSISFHGRVQESDLCLVKGKFCRDDNRKRAQEAFNIIQAYETLGSEVLRSTDFKKTKIDLLLKKHTEKTNKEKMKSHIIMNSIREKFPDFEYTKEDLINGIQEIFDCNGISVKVNFSTVKKYYSVRELRGRNSNGTIQLLNFQLDETF